ncbi:MAG: hypothetical protein M0D53_12690 [Flavobacterium sp. JAD_PAG50586_2]|nr:MAG: hypothetical protein M0D53_12690 [Flavobacterium sp. JAD_PAG50586_2]
MILQKIKELHRILDNYTEVEQNRLGIKHPMDMQKVKRIIRGGKWSVLTYAAHPKSIGTDDLRILPWLPGSEWPAVTTDNADMQSVSRHLNILARFTEPDFYLCYESRDYCEKLVTKWDLFYEAIIPVYRLFGGTDDLAELKEYVFDKKNWPSKKISSEEIKKKKRQHKLKLDPGRENQYLYKLVDEWGKYDYLPSLPDFDLGIYENRILSMFSYKASVMLRIEHFEKPEEAANILLQAVNYAHGFDTETNSVSDGTGGIATSMTVFDPIKKLFSPYSKITIPAELKTTPEYYIAKKMHEAQKGYNGTAHIEMAAVMDEAGNPKRAWTYLVSAGYWAARSLPEAQPVILQAAIDLCGRNGWLEAKEVLEYNMGVLKSI